MLVLPLSCDADSIHDPRLVVSDEVAMLFVKILGSVHFVLTCISTAHFLQSARTRYDRQHCDSLVGWVDALWIYTGAS
jgi:hypothetical protein